MATVTSTGEGGWIVRDESGELVPHHAEIAGFLENCDYDHTLQVCNEGLVGDAYECLELGSFVPGRKYRLSSNYMSDFHDKIVMCIEGHVRCSQDEKDFDDYLRGAGMYLTIEGEQNAVSWQDVHDAPFWTMYTVHYTDTSRDEDSDSTTPDCSESDDDGCSGNDVAYQKS
jgi:hypothetical protein